MRPHLKGAMAPFHTGRSDQVNSHRARHQCFLSPSTQHGAAELRGLVAGFLTRWGQNTICNKARMSKKKLGDYKLKVMA